MKHGALQAELDKHVDDGHFPLTNIAHTYVPGRVLMLVARGETADRVMEMIDFSVLEADTAPAPADAPTEEEVSVRRVEVLDGVRDTQS